MIMKNKFNLIKKISAVIITVFYMLLSVTNVFAACPNGQYSADSNGDYSSSGTICKPIINCLECGSGSAGRCILAANKTGSMNEIPSGGFCRASSTSNFSYCVVEAQAVSVCTPAAIAIADNANTSSSGSTGVDSFGLNAIGKANTESTGSKAFSSKSAPTVISDLINLFLGLSSTLVLVGMIIAGVKLIVSQGKPDEMKKAFGFVKGVVLGLFLIITAYAISQFVLSQIKFLAT